MPRSDAAVNSAARFRSSGFLLGFTGAILGLLPASCGPRPANRRRPRRTVTVTRQLDPPPKKTKKSAAKPAGVKSGAKLGVLTLTGDDDVFVSTAGLRYGTGSKEGTRLKHVMRHAKDLPTRPGPHGVFDGAPAVIRALIDEAYLLAKAKSDRVKFSGEGKRGVYTIDMKRRIGYVGGKTGKEQGHPETRHLRLVLEGKNVISAFPVRP